MSTKKTSTKKTSTKKTSTKKTSTLGWHFLSDAGKMRDGTIPARVETYKGTVAICKSGLHASTELRDALRYAPGAILCRVRCRDVVMEHVDKFVCRERRILWAVDAKDALREFARRCALRAARVHAANACAYLGLPKDAAALRGLSDDATADVIRGVAIDTAYATATHAAYAAYAAAAATHAAYAAATHATHATHAAYAAAAHAANAAAAHAANATAAAYATNVTNAAYATNATNARARELTWQAELLDKIVRALPRIKVWSAAATTNERSQ